MRYKTIILELLQAQPDLYEELRTNRRLLSAVETYANELKADHEDRMEEIARKKPYSDSCQISSDALALAIEDLQARLPCASPRDEAALTLDALMSHIRRHTPPA